MFLSNSADTEMGKCATQGLAAGSVRLSRTGLRSCPVASHRLLILPSRRRRIDTHWVPLAGDRPPCLAEN
jgi:hypothetical protein